MIKIKKGDSVLTVTRGAYTNYFKDLGYRVVRATKTPETLEGVSIHPDKDSDLSGDLSQLKIFLEDESDELTEEDEEEEELDLSEIPLSEMTGSQLRQYAEELGLPYEGLKKRELRELIRNNLK